MANKRIGQTTNKTSQENGDKIPFERANVMYHIDVDDLNTAQSDTYANWATAKTGSTLPIGRWIYVSDKSVYLFCIGVNAFALKGIWKNTVSSVDYYNSCDYDFTNNYFTKIEDYLYNSIKVTSSAKHIWNDSRYSDNTCLTLNGWDITGALGYVQANLVSSGATLNATSSAITSEVKNNTIDSTSNLICTAIAGKFNQNVIISSTDVTAIMNSGVLIQDCVFGNRQSIVLNPATAYTGKSIRSGYSNFDVTISITSVTTLTNSATYGGHVGIIYLTSSNATETINLFANAPQNQPFRIYPVSGLTVTFTHATGANQPILKGAANKSINGTKGEWVEITYSSLTSRFYETNSGQY